MIPFAGGHSSLPNGPVSFSVPPLHAQSADKTVHVFLKKFSEAVGRIIGGIRSSMAGWVFTISSLAARPDFLFRRSPSQPRCPVPTARSQHPSVGRKSH